MMATKQEHLYKVLIVGDAAVGKTSMMLRYAKGIFLGNCNSTMGVEFEKKVLQWSDSEIVKLHLWDISGEERFINMTHVYYRGAGACVIMFDVTKRDTFLRSKWWKYDLDSKVKLSDGSPVPCILLANKCDQSPWEVTKEEISEFSKENKFIGWTETSVKENKNISESMRYSMEMKSKPVTSQIKETVALSKASVG